MKRVLKTIFLFALCFLVVFISTNRMSVVAAEDTTAPKLIFVEVKETAITAGEAIEVRVKVEESGTGLVSALVQYNHSKSGDIMVCETIHFDKPLYSSKNKYIEQVFTVPTRTNAVGGDWFLGYLEFTDQKGNFSRYCGNPNNEEIRLDGKTSGFVAKTHVSVSGTTGDATKPQINAIQIGESVVEKPGELKIQARISEGERICNVQIDLESKADRFVYQESAITSVDGKGNYVIRIPIGENRHVGDWSVTDVRFSDDSGNAIHYTSGKCDGFFSEYSGIYEEKFSLLTFTVTGQAMDEVAPSVTGIEVLNDETSVYKPGILKVRVNIVEDGDGVSGLYLMYEIPVDFDNPADGSAVANSRGGCYFALKGTEPYFSDTPVVSFDKPLKTGSHVFEIPVPSVKPNGEYILYIDHVKDKAENEKRYGSKAGVFSKFTVVDEYEYAFETGITNDALRDYVKALEEGEVGRILLDQDPARNVITKQVLGDIAGSDKTLICYRDGYQWIFRGNELDKSKVKDLSLTVRVFEIDGDDLSSGKAATGISFESNGELPGKVEFRFKTAFVKEFFGKEENLLLYHVENSEGGYETEIDYEESEYEQIPPKEANIQVILEEKDAWCYVDLVHNSKYVLSDRKLTKLSKATAAPKKTTTKAEAMATTTTTVLMTESTTNATTDTAGTVTQSSSTTASGTLPMQENTPDNNGGIGIVVAVVLVLVAGAGVGIFIFVRKKQNQADK